MSGRLRELPCFEHAQALSFAMTTEDPILVSGHDSGHLRIWDVADGALRQTVSTGDGPVEDIYVAESGDQTRVWARSSGSQVRCWSLKSGKPLGVLDTPQPNSMCGSRLVDGRSVLLTVGESLALWDLDDGARLDLQAPPELGTVRRTVLSTHDRDYVTVVGEYGSILTFDLATGAQMGPPITDHANALSNRLMHMVHLPRPYPRLAVVSGTLAVPTQWRVTTVAGECEGLVHAISEAGERLAVIKDYGGRAS
ncbi:hypothetical protein Ssi02_27060 [Sinosporangium siamense]|uniref:WD40 repeat domain-containing protein n=2 Tax=Sinosporangium siamense TaxID=1367973 RepID=A0A919V507_9ACTN|nr:hypothetical protein Ssi02_27060 [Sinosporangium siamense]